MLGGTGGGNQKMQLGFSIYLKDNFSATAAKVKGTMDGMKQEYQSYRSNLTALRDTSLAVATAALGISYGLYNAAMEGAEFLHTMQGVLAISEATVGEFRILKDLAVSLGRETIFTPDQVASGMRFMAMAGQTASQIQATAQDATYLAAATMTQLGGKLGAADILTNALKAFGLAVSESTQMSDLLTYATTSANVSLVDLGNSIRYVASTSKNLNIPVEDTIGMIMALGNAGIQSSMAGTALENMFRYLAMSISDFATKRQKTAWQTIGLGKEDIMDATGSFRPMVEILSKIKGELDQLGSVDRQNILKEIFGVRGQRAAGTILRNLDEAGGFIEQLNNPAIGGTAESKSALMMETLKGASLKLTSALDGLKAAWAEAIGGIFLKKFLVGLSKMVAGLTTFVKIPAVGFMLSIGAAVLTLGGLFIGFRAILYTIALAVDGVTTSFSRMAIAGRVAMARVTGAAAGYSTSAVAAQRSGMIMMGGKTGKVSPIGASKPILGGALKSGGMLRWLPKIAKGLGGLLGTLMGPIGMGIVLVVTLLPLLISGISSLTSATNANIEAMKPPQTDLGPAELLMLLGDVPLKEIIMNMNRNHTEMVRLGLIHEGYLNEQLSTQQGTYTAILHSIPGAVGDINVVVSEGSVGVQGVTKHE